MSLTCTLDKTWMWCICWRCEGRKRPRWLFSGSICSAVCLLQDDQTPGLLSHVRKQQTEEPDLLQHPPQAAEVLLCLTFLSYLCLFVLSASLFSSFGSLSSLHLVSRAAVTEVNRLVIDLFSTARQSDGPKSSALYLPHYLSDAAPIVWPFVDVQLPHLCWR